MLKKFIDSTYKYYYILWQEKSFALFFRLIHSYRKDGLEGMYRRIQKEYTQKKSTYEKWILTNETNILYTEALDYTPLISIITPTYNTSKTYLSHMIDSVRKQTYTHWELCIADDASTSQETLNTLKKYAALDRRIKIIYRERNGHISEASNSALALATGVYVTFLDHDDMLAPHALYEMAKKLNENKNLKLIYSDEDKIDAHNKRFYPHFKSGWNPDMFFSQNYIAHLTLIQKSIVEAVQGFRKGYEGSQDYDLYLRCLKQIDPASIAHIEKVLYHWRAIEGSTALSPSAKNYTTVAGVHALQDYFKESHQKVTVEKGLLPNTYKVSYLLPDTPPLVSLLIPTRDGYEILFKCITSILEKTIYPNYEIIILDNETTDAQTLAYFETLKVYDHIRILEYHYPFNYSAINNFGVQHAKGEIIGLVNNDVEVISHHWLTEMVSHALREDIGAVGAMLYYDNETIQHAGVILGIGGVAGHSHKYFPRHSEGYFSRLKIIQNYSAVTGACLVVKKSLYLEVNGLNEQDLTVAFNDVDFCLKLLEKGYRNLWTPYVELYHHESISRGQEDNPVKIERFNNEVSFMKQKWNIILKGDKYYNSNLTQQYEDFRIMIDE